VVTARLPETHLTLYSELLEQALAFERLAGPAGSMPGALVEKTIRGRRYLYWQVRAGGQTVQRYLGPDEPPLRRELAALAAHRRDLEEERVALARLSAMLLRGGAAREEAGPARALGLLSDLGFFRRGAVLVGIQAFRCYGNALGLMLASATLRTQDIDLAHSVEIAIACSVEPAPAVERELGSIGFLPVPGLDPREPSTSFRMRGRDLRIDFLVPMASRRSEKPVAIPALGIAAQPLPFLDYLIEQPMPAVVLAARPVLVRIARPGRFGLHKLWTAEARGPAQAAKARTDRVQGAVLLSALLEDRPDEVDEAWQALADQPAARRRIRKSLLRLDGAMVEPVLRVLRG
jgi:hypothetical protein